MKISSFLSLVGVVFCALLALLTGEAQAQTPKNLQIYILMGQSNMVGQDPSTLDSQVDDPRILALNANNQWEVAREPMYIGGIGVGPGIPFAREMLRANPDATIGLVPCAVSGTALNQWIPGAKPYIATINRAKAAASSGTLRGVLWHQGETDAARLEYANSYETRLAQAFRDLRQDLGQPNLPIVVGQLGEFVTLDRFPYVDMVRAALMNLPFDLERVRLASSTGLTDKGDQLHFSAGAQDEFGRRYAHEMQRLQKIPALENTTLVFGLGKDVAGAQLQGHDGDDEPLTYQLTAGTLPEGITLNEDGSFSGIPTATTAAQGVPVSITVSDGLDGRGTATVTILVKDYDLIVSTPSDSTPGSETDTDGLVSLREAVTYANAHPGPDTITFDPTVFSSAQTILLPAILPKLNEDVSLIGPGAKRLTIELIPSSLEIPVVEPPTGDPEDNEEGAENQSVIFRINSNVNVNITGLTLSNALSAINNLGSVRIADCLLSGNDTGIENQGTAYLTGCTLSSSDTGVLSGGNATLLNCTLSDNFTAGIVNSGVLNATNCTVSRNTIGFSNSGVLTLTNTLVVGNSGGNIDGGFSDGGHNLTTGTALLAGLDPAGLKDNGGPTPTIALVTPIGKAVNTGDNLLLPSDILTDQRGAGFKRIVTRTVDIGAFELDLNKAPSDITLTRSSVPEDAGDNALVGTLFGVDPNAGDILTFTVPVGVDDNDFFVLSSSNQLLARTSFDYETLNQYLVTVVVTDAAGLSFAKQFTISVTETTKPIISITTPSVNQKLFIQNFIRNSIRGEAQDNVGVNLVKIRLSRKRNNINYYWSGSDWVTGQWFMTAALTMSAQTGKANVGWYLSGQLPPESKLDVGAYQIRVYAKDAAGNQTAYLDQNFALQSDFSPPTIILAAPATNQKVLLSDFIAGTTRGMAADNIGVVGVKVRLARKNGSMNVYWNGNDFTPTTTFVDADMTGTTSASWQFKNQLPPEEQLTAGAYSVSAYAYDEAGNKSETLTVSFNLNTDYTLPTVGITTPWANQILDINALGTGTFSALPTTTWKLPASNSSCSANGALRSNTGTARTSPRQSPWSMPPFFLALARLSSGNSTSPFQRTNWIEVAIPSTLRRPILQGILLPRRDGPSPYLALLLLTPTPQHWSPKPMPIRHPALVDHKVLPPLKYATCFHSLCYQSSFDRSSHISRLGENESGRFAQ